jgi:hypothetical protein
MVLHKKAREARAVTVEAIYKDASRLLSTTPAFGHPSWPGGAIRMADAGLSSVTPRYCENHLADTRLAVSTAPGSSNLLVAAGMIVSSFRQDIISRACRFSRRTS